MDSAVKPRAEKLKILIMSAPIGSGHQMAANALEESLTRLENVEVVQGNVFSFFPSFLGDLFLRSYEKILRICPGLYAMSYRWGNRNSGSLWMRNGINSLLLRLGRSFIERVRPDVVYSTHATPTGIFSLYKEKYDPGLWLGVVVTDFTVHRWLICNGVDAYFLADERLRGQIAAVASGAADKDRSDREKDGLLPNENGSENGLITDSPACYAFGIPVRSAFCQHRDVAAAHRDLRKRFGWPKDAFVCLLVGGGGGMLPMEAILRELRRETTGNIYFVAVAGHNADLRKKLEAQAGGADSHLKVFGFTKELSQLMTGSDLVITKGGGVSLAECLACGSDIVIYSPLPGQEQANTVFVQQAYGVKAANDTKRLAEILRQAAGLPYADRIQQQNKRRSAFGRPEAAQRIAEFTQNLHLIM